MCVVAAVMPSTAQTTHTREGVTYTVNGNTATVTAVGTDVAAKLTISSPITIDGVNYVVCVGNDGGTASLFADSGLTSLTLSGEFAERDGVAAYAFARCTTLKSVDLSGMRGSAAIGGHAFAGCTSLKSIQFPLSTNFTTIPEYVAADCLYLSEVTIPDHVTYVGAHAFENNRISNLTLPNSLQVIGDNAFEENILESVQLGNSSLTNIGTSAFANNSINDLTLPRTLLSIGASAFQNNKVMTVTLPENCTSLGAYAFASNMLMTINWNGKITSVNEGVFANNYLSQLSIPEGIKSIRNEAFAGNPLASIKLPEGLEGIGDSAFAASSDATKAPTYTELSIPATVINIGTRAFYGATGLKNLYLYADPEHNGSYKIFGSEAFAGEGSQLANVYTINAVPPTLVATGGAPFTQETYDNAELHVLEGSYDAYKAANEWVKFLNFTDSSLTGIGKLAAGAAEDVTEVFTLSGVRVYRGAEEDMSLPAGVYVVRSGGVARQVAF